MLALALPVLAGLALPAAPSAASGSPPCLRVAPGDALQAALDAAPPGAVLCLEAGRYAGPVQIRKPVTLRGPRSARIESHGTGTTVTLAAAGAGLEGVTVDGSGGRFDLLDAAVGVGADDARVVGVRIENALFGILVQQARGPVLRGNEIVGAPERPLGLRGDGIRLWEVQGAVVEDNHVRDGRDVVVWYSSNNRFVANEVVRSRYGSHFMYSHHNVVSRSRYVGNVVGLFAMYSRDLHVQQNVFARSGGAAGVGVGSKESEGLEVVGNWFLEDSTGIYLDTSPLQEDQENHFTNNVFRYCDTAVVFHGTVARNHFERNVFRDGGAPVRVEGRGDAMAAEWLGNEYDDYAGYDLDGDGVGDVPYALRSLSSDWIDRTPSLAFFRGSAALALVEMVGRAVPLFAPQTLLVDPQPRLHVPRPERPDAG